MRWRKGLKFLWWGEIEVVWARRGDKFLPLTLRATPEGKRNGHQNAWIAMLPSHHRRPELRQ